MCLIPSWVYNSTPCDAKYILVIQFFRIYDAVAERLPNVDVDGSYLYRNRLFCIVMYR